MSYRRATPYRLDEDRAILNYILEKERFDALRGNGFWKKMEKDKVLDRTWQSMKDRFKKHIVVTLRFPGYNLTAEQASKIQTGYKNTASLPTKMKNEQTQKSIGMDSVLDVVNHRSALPYALDEDLAILEYILENNNFNRLRGNQFWMEMEGKQFTNRSWQSMKERFKKHIVVNLDWADYNLPADEISKIIKGYEKTVKYSSASNNQSLEHFAASTDESIENEDEDTTQIANQSVDLAN